MTGSAVVTTRLSSCAMNSATLVTTNVQIVRDLALIARSFRRTYSECSLTSEPKKNSRVGQVHARGEPGRRDAGLDPLGRMVGPVHRRDDIHEHPHREEL